MKKFVKYNLKHSWTLGLLTALAVSGCNPDDDYVNDKKHSIMLFFDEESRNIDMDTIAKYNADRSVDTIFMVPEDSYMFAEWETRFVHHAANALRQRHNVNPNKVFGHGNLHVSSLATPDDIKFFRDTLKYNVIMNTVKNNTK